mgnify:FL=1|tara:strand:+ start:380 stop:664 length:285 start_codon:yes stop_codon:yes gene_type:complete
MKTFQQFQEGIGKLRILPTLAKGAAATYAIKKGAEFLGRKSGESDVKKAQPKKPSKPKYQNPSDGSIPGRRKDESLKDYYKRRNQGYNDQIDKM